MNVFTPAESKRNIEQRTDTDLRRARTIAEATKDLLAVKKETEDAFEDSMRRQQKESEEWFLEQHEKKSSLLREVENLEERKRIALSPPLIRAEDIHSVEESLWARELQLRVDEEKNEDDSRLLMRKLDIVSSRDQDLDARETRVKKMEQGAELQRTQIAQDAKNLSKETERFAIEMEQKETEFAYRKSEQDAHENVLTERDRLMIERENEVEVGKKLLADHRMLLEKGFLELNRLKAKQL